MPVSPVAAVIVPMLVVRVLQQAAGQRTAAADAEVLDEPVQFLAGRWIGTDRFDAVHERHGLLDLGLDVRGRLAIQHSRLGVRQGLLVEVVDPHFGEPVQLFVDQRDRRVGQRPPRANVGCDARFEVPRSFLSTLKAGFFSWAQTGLETALLAGRPHCGMECRQRLWMAMSGSSTIRP
jgi:hypothetical protein